MVIEGDCTFIERQGHVGDDVLLVNKDELGCIHDYKVMGYVQTFLHPPMDGSTGGNSDGGGKRWG